jgi:2,5-diketo-D-gluconate reductase A
MSMPNPIPAIFLNDGHTLPQLGLGTWQIADDDVPAVLDDAFAMGYRAIDTAAAYENERGVGEGIRRSGLPRQSLAITTKLANDRHGYDTALRAFDASLGRLGLDYVDLYLIHWPLPMHDLYVETWKALIEIKDQGRARSIGVSNFNVEHLERLLEETGTVPAVNQIELHPRFQQKALRNFHSDHGIATESWSPLGQATFLQDPVLGSLARKHGKSPAQIILRWHLDNGLIVIPKSAHAGRLQENIDVMDFKLDDDDMSEIAGMDRADGRTGPDPLTFDEL